MHWRRKWQPTPAFLPGESQGRGSLVGCHLWGHTELVTTEATQQQQQQLPSYVPSTFTIMNTTHTHEARLKLPESLNYFWQSHFTLLLVNKLQQEGDLYLTSSYISHHPWQKSFGHVIYGFFYSFSFVLKVVS